MGSGTSIHQANCNHKRTVAAIQISNTTDIKNVTEIKVYFIKIEGSIHKEVMIPVNIHASIDPVPNK